MAALVFLLSSATVGTQSPKEVRITRLHVDGVPANLSSLAEIVKRADAVVVAEVLGSKRSNIAPSGFIDEAGTFTSTAYTVRIAEFVAGPSETKQGTELTVEVPGIGEIDRGSYIERFESERFAPLVTGESYVLFVRQHSLGRSPAPAVWMPATGDNQSIVDIRGGVLKPRAATAASLELARMTLSKLVADVRALWRDARR
jgi:hypothetical protein